MSKEPKPYKSVAYAVSSKELSLNFCNGKNCRRCYQTDCDKTTTLSHSEKTVIREEIQFKASWNDIQQSSPLDNKSRLTRARVFQVRAMTKAGGDPLKLIMYTPRADDQYTLLMQKFKVMGFDRPTVRPWHSCTSQERSDMIADYASGMSVAEICKKHNISDSVIYRNGVISRKAPVRTPKMQAEVLKLYEAGKSCNDISKILDVHHNVTRLIILKAHPDMKSLSNKPFVRLTQEKTDEILKMFNNGMIIGHIAKLTGHSKSTVERIVGHVPLMSYKKNNDEVRDQLHTCWTLGESLGSTSKKLNRAKSTVKFWFDKFKKGDRLGSSFFYVFSMSNKT
jgi:transposase